RPVAAARAGRPDRDYVRRAAARDRHGRRDPPRAVAPLHQGPAQLVPLAPRPAPRSGRHPRLTARPARLAARLPVPAALRVRYVGVRGGRHAPTSGGHVQGPGARDGLPVRAAGHAGPATAGCPPGNRRPENRRRADVTEQATTLTSAAAARGELAMEAIAVSKDFKIGRGQIVHAVRDVSFNLYRGAVVALVGESGSGKSTAARLLAGQERLTSGTIKLVGKPVDVSSHSDFRHYMSAGAVRLPGPVRVA